MHAVAMPQNVERRVWPRPMPVGEATEIELVESDWLDTIPDPDFADTIPMPDETALPVVVPEVIAGLEVIEIFTD